MISPSFLVIAASRSPPPLDSPPPPLDLVFDISVAAASRSAASSRSPPPPLDLDQATTHTDLVVRAKKLGVKVEVIHNASVMNAVGVCGLQLYRYGETVSIPFFTETWRPDSFYEKIRRNRQLGLHTLCLLDIRVKEPSLESLCRGKKCYELPRYMTINIAIDQLLEIEEKRGECVYRKETKCVGLARLGYKDQMIVAGPMKDLLDVDFGVPLHCLVIVGETHPVEEEMLEFYTIK